MDIKSIQNKIVKGASIYVSDKYVDVVKVKLGMQGMVIEDIKRYSLSKNIKKSQYNQCADVLNDVLSKAFPSDEEPPYRIATNLRNDSLILRKFQLRDMPDAELNAAISFEIQKYIPYSLEDLVYSYKKHGKNNDQLSIGFYGAEKLVIDDIKDYFAGRHMCPVIIEAFPVLIASQYSQERKTEKNKLYLSVHYEPPNKVILTGIWNNQAQFVREMSLLSGEDVFSTTQFDYPPVKDVWGLLEQDVIRTMEYLKKEINQPVQNILISGFARSKQESDISKDFGIELIRADMPKINCPKEISELDRYLPAIGLAQRLFVGGIANFSPKSVQDADPWAYKFAAAGLCAGVAAVLALHILVRVFLIGTEVQKIQNINAQIDSYGITSSSANESEITAFMDIMKSRTAFLNNEMLSRIKMTEKIGQLANIISNNAWVDELSLKIQPAPGGTGGPEQKIMIIKGGVFSPPGEGVPEINKMTEAMRSDEKMMEGFTDIKLLSAKRSQVQDKEITEFQTIFK